MAARPPCRYLSQMVGLTTQNFVSAASGMAVAAAVARGLASRQTRTVGNFWADLRALDPLRAAAARDRAGAGARRARRAADARRLGDARTTLEGAEQTIALGPVASQIAIKQLGTNGGGFFNVNSAHPFENPTAIANLLTLISILLIPVAFCFTYGRMVGDTRQGRALFAAMGVLLVVAVAGLYAAERLGNPLHARPDRCRRPATWRARRSASASSARRCGRRSPPRPPTARSTPCTTR